MILLKEEIKSIEFQHTHKKAQKVRWNSRLTDYSHNTHIKFTDLNMSGPPNKIPINSRTYPHIQASQIADWISLKFVSFHSFCTRKERTKKNAARLPKLLKKWGAISKIKAINSIKLKSHFRMVSSFHHFIWTQSVEHLDRRLIPDFVSPYIKLI